MAAESFLVQTLTALIMEFSRRGFNYALAGGWAYSALVEPRATTDIDLLILVKQPSRERIHSMALATVRLDRGAPSAHGLSGAVHLAMRGNSQRSGSRHRSALGGLGVSSTALASRRIVPFDSLQMPILTIEDLIVLKTLAGRLQDQADLETIRARQDELHIDWNYVEEWKARVGLRRSCFPLRCEWGQVLQSHIVPTGSYSCCCLQREPGCSPLRASTEHRPSCDNLISLVCAVCEHRGATRLPSLPSTAANTTEIPSSP